MEKIMTLMQIATACGGLCENAAMDTTVSDVVTDSRKITDGSVFVALRGDRFDGHNFAAQAIKNGAVCCVVDNRFENSEELPVIIVEDTYAAFRDIGAAYRRMFDIPVVAITGSVGKTSTKDMISCVLRRKYKTHSTEGNFNNEIGVPMTVLRLKKEDEISVLEMGMSAFGEISRLTRIASPETAVITNIGFSHIEHLGSRENILKAKLEILEGLSQDGTVILNGDDPYLKELEGTLPFETLCYGIENTSCDITAVNIKKFSERTEFDVNVEGESYHAVVNAAGGHHVYNALSAILVGLKYNMTVPEIVEGIKEFVPGGMRQHIETLENYVLIKDCYNASPTSMKSGFEVLAVTQPKDKEREFRRVAVLGDMLELGEFAEGSHREVGGLSCDYGLGCLIAVGSNARFVAEGAIEKGFNSSEIYVFYDNTTVKEHIMDIIKPNDVILLKGSRGMHLEEIAEFIEEKDK